MKERLWYDIKNLAEKRINEGNTTMETKAQRKRFWLKKVTNNFIRVEREDSRLPYEDIPRTDFIDIWRDMNEKEYISIGYMQSDLHRGQNRHSALSFALVGMLPYIEWRKVGNAWKLFLKYQPQWVIEVEENPNPSLARVVIAGEWDGDVNTSKKLLQEVCDKWPKGKRGDCLITCGAFLNFDWPKSLPDIGDNKNPNETALNLLNCEAEKQCDLLIDEELREKLLVCADFITIGIDSQKDKISLSDVSIRQPHVELVALMDLKAKRYFWTGKSYPTTGQENGLVRIRDLSTHFVKLPFGKVMILGCHDLNVFSPRGKAVTKSEWRKKVREEFYNIAKKETPSVVLHHPHTTDSSRIWTSAWNELVEIAPSVEKYISAGRYFNQDGERSNINEVLGKTKCGNTIDFIVNIEE